MNALLSALLSAGLVDGDTANRIDRQLDDAAMRRWAEDELLRAFQAGLAAQRDRLIDAVRQYNGDLPDVLWDRLWAEENTRLWEAVRPTLLDIAAEHVAAAAVSMGADQDMWHLVNEQVIVWAETRYIDPDGDVYGSIPNLNLTSRTDFQRAFVDWQRGELQTAGLQDGLPQLIRSLEPVFGVERAAVIAPTEVTRLFVESERAAAADNEFIEGFQFLISEDERVCPVCSPAADSVTEKGSDTFPDGRGWPPRHPRCRCSVSPLSSAAIQALREEGLVVSP